MIQYGNIVLIGFLVWLGLAPQVGSPRYRELFLAYMVALLFCFTGTSELIKAKPVAFFFNVGGALAFVYVVARTTMRISFRKE